MILFNGSFWYTNKIIYLFISIYNFSQVIIWLSLQPFDFWVLKHIVIVALYYCTTIVDKSIVTIRKLLPRKVIFSIEFFRKTLGTISIYGKAWNMSTTDFVKCLNRSVFQVDVIKRSRNVFSLLTGFC